jgi:hypothetical protein
MLLGSDTSIDDSSSARKDVDNSSKENLNMVTLKENASTTGVNTGIAA